MTRGEQVARVVALAKEIHEAASRDARGIATAGFSRDACLQAAALMIALEEPEAVVGGLPEQVRQKRSAQSA